MAANSKTPRTIGSKGGRLGRPPGSPNKVNLSQLSDADATALRGMALRGSLDTKGQIKRMEEIAEYMAKRNRAELFLDKSESISIQAEIKVLKDLLAYSLPALAMVRVNQTDMDEKIANSGIVVLPALDVSLTDDQRDSDSVVSEAEHSDTLPNGNDS